jgi:cystathionine gamma-lyase
MNPTHRFRTRAIHVGNERDPATGAVVPPVHVASTYVQPAAGEWGPFDYSRSGNPTRTRLEETLASLESGAYALAFASGMAATHAVCQLLNAGDHVVAGAEIYGGTYRLLHQVMKRLGVETTLARSDRLDELEAAFRPNTKLLWIESPGNPLLTVTDVAACAELARRRGAILGVDNTFASPALTRPLELGADVVMHSATKYLGGHSDMLGGALIVNDRDLRNRLYFIQNATGGVMAPFDAFLCQRGIKTLELRVREQSRSADRIARWLAGHPQVARVYYPGLETHPGHELARRQMQGGFGAVLSFDLRTDLAGSKRFASATKLFQLAVSLGAVESLIAQPASMSHASYDAAARRKLGVGDGLIRLSVGLEDCDDLVADLEAAFRAV